MSYGSFAKRFEALTANSTQTTSVSSNNASFSMVREGIDGIVWPPNAFSITARASLLDWTAPPNFQCLIYANYYWGGIEESVFYGHVSGQLRLFSNTTGEVPFASGFPTDWLYITVTWDGDVDNPMKWSMAVGDGAPVDYTWIPSSTVPEGQVPLLSRVQVFNDIYDEQAVDAHACTVIVWNGKLTPAEEAAQRLQDTPIDTSGGSGATVWSWYSMDDAATAYIDQSGNGRNMTPTGTGVTVVDSPY